MRRVAAAVCCVAVCSVAVLAGCSVEAVELPVPGSYVSGESYSIDIEFASVLNLPSKAKVVVGGVDAGILDTVELVMGLEEEFGNEIPDEDAEKLTSVGDVIRFIEESQD